MQNFLTQLTALLSKDERLVGDGKLLKNKIAELALKLDAQLIELLLSEQATHDMFFVQAGKVTLFDQDKFLKFVSSKQFLPDSYTAFRNKIGLTVNNYYLTENKQVVLSWPYKDTVLEGGQTKADAKRDEIFWNQILAPDQISRLFEPKVLTNAKRVDKQGEHPLKVFSTNTEGQIIDNLLIRGNNLLALHSIRKQYKGRVKLIYIDPPFNREDDDFQYNDKFNHSTWLTFMLNRIAIAKHLLHKDGFLCIHIDDIESAYLKVLLDEELGRENFVNTICIRDSHPSGLKTTHKDKKIIKTKSYILVYKASEQAKITPIYQRRSEWDTHFNIFVDIDSRELKRSDLKSKLIEEGIISSESEFSTDALKNIKFKEFVLDNRNKIFQSTKELPESVKKRSLVKENEIIEYLGPDGTRELAYNGRRLSPLSRSIQNIGFDKYYEEDFAKLLADFWDDVDFNNTQGEGGVSFPNGKKPELLLARLISMFTSPGDIVLDFFLGSGTTASVAVKLTRTFIGIEQIDYGNNDSLNRLKNVVSGDETGISKFVGWQGGGDFVYLELAQKNSLLHKKIQDAKTPSEIREIWSAIKNQNLAHYNLNTASFEKDFDEFAKLSVEKQKRFLLEILDQNHLYINYSDIDDEEYQVSDYDKKVSREFYSG